MTVWYKIPGTLPPGDDKAPMQGRLSARVWLALPDSSVVIGQCLHWDARRPAGAVSPVHSWFIEPLGQQRAIVFDGQPLAWTHIVPPSYTVEDRPPGVPSVAKLLAEDVVKNWPVIDEAYQRLHKRAQGVALQHWHQERVNAARMYTRATLVLDEPTAAEAIELLNSV